MPFTQSKIILEGTKRHLTLIFTIILCLSSSLFSNICLSEEVSRHLQNSVSRPQNSHIWHNVPKKWPHYNLCGLLFLSQPIHQSAGNQEICSKFPL